MTKVFMSSEDEEEAYYKELDELNTKKVKGDNMIVGKSIEIKPGMIRSHPTLVDPKVSMQLIYRRGTSMVWMTPSEARETGNKLIEAAEKCRHTVRVNE